MLSAEQALQLAGGEGSVVVTVTDEGDEEDGKMNKKLVIQYPC